MGNFKFTADSVLEFHCPGIGTSTDQHEAQIYFKRYLNRIGKSDTELLSAEDFMVRYCAPTDYINNTLNKQYSGSYTNGDENLYRGFLYNNCSSYLPCLGYVTLPFKVNGSNIRIVLPGTVVSTYTGLSMQTSGSGTIERTATSLSIKNTSTGKTTSYPASTFANNVIPLFLVAQVVGGGGGGSSSESVYAGRGGGGGGYHAGVISLIGSSILNFEVGIGGAGGSHNSSDSSTSSNHDGKQGYASTIKDGNNVTTFLCGNGGKGGVAQSGSYAQGGTTSGTPAYSVYKDGTSTAFSGAAGKPGSVDTNNVAASITTYKLSPFKGSPSCFNQGTFGSVATYKPGTSYNPGGAGGGATWLYNGANGGSGTNAGSNGVDGYGTGGGGGGYLITQYIKGGKGGTGRVQLHC